MLLIQLWRKADCRAGPFLDFKEEPTSFKIIQIFTISKFPREKHVSLCIKVTDLSSSAGPDDLGNLSNCLNSLNREKSFKISWGLNELHCKKYLAHNICSINFLLLSWLKKKKSFHSDKPLKCKPNVFRGPFYLRRPGVGDPWASQSPPRFPSGQGRPSD